LPVTLALSGSRGRGPRGGGLGSLGSLGALGAFGSLGPRGFLGPEAGSSVLPTRFWAGSLAGSLCGCGGDLRRDTAWVTCGGRGDLERKGGAAFQCHQLSAKRRGWSSMREG
jgi:hypothetical protein